MSLFIRRYVLTEFSQNLAVEGAPSYALGILRWSSVGFTVAIGKDAGVVWGGWKGKMGKRFPVWVMGVGDGGVGTQGSTVTAENWLERSSANHSSDGEGRCRLWGVLVVSREEDSLMLSSEGLSRGSVVRVFLQRRGFR